MAAQTFIRWARLGVWERLLVAGPGARRATRDDVPRRHQRPRPPEGGGRCGQKGDRGATRRGEALGRSRGGYGTKACVIADGPDGRSPSACAGPGARTAPCRAAARTPARRATWVVADRGYASHAFREHIWNLGARPAIPPKRNEAPVACPELDLQQPQPRRAALGPAEGMAGRRNPLREDRLLFMGVLCLAAALDWLKS